MKRQIICGIKVLHRRRNDNVDFIPLLERAVGLVPVGTVVADRGYDSEQNHIAAENLGIPCTIIRPRYESLQVWKTKGFHKKNMKRHFDWESYRQRSNIVITKDGTTIGSIPGSISCPPTTTGTIGLSDSGANDFRAQVSMTTPGGSSFGPSACTIGGPADLSEGVGFDPDPVTSWVVCTSPPSTSTKFTLIEAPTQAPVGGELASIDATTLLTAGLVHSAVWMIPTLAGFVGDGIFLARKRN